MLLNIWQVYFDEQSKNNCYKEFRKYDNSKKLTEFFENSVILDLYKKKQHKKAEYFGVWSHDIKNELVFKEQGMRFTPKNLETVVSNNQGVEVFGFQKHRRNQNIITQADQWHPGITQLFRDIIEATGLFKEIPKRIDNIIMFNHFIAKRHFWEGYINDLLIPAMKLLKANPSAYRDAKYNKRFDQDTRQRFQKAYGLDYIPYHPFVCERLPSLYLQKFKFNVKHIF